jgi:hypothetical protein
MVFKHRLCQNIQFEQYKLFPATAALPQPENPSGSSGAYFNLSVVGNISLATSAYMDNIAAPTGASPFAFNRNSEGRLSYTLMINEPAMSLCFVSSKRPALPASTLRTEG